MATERILKPLLSIFTSPLSFASLLLSRFGPTSLRSDLENCVELATRLGDTVPDVFIEAIFLAEDHRNKLHPGIDVIAIARAVWVRIRLGKVQGASTIEQQFVRIVTGRRERTFRRKIREQLLALMLARRKSKRGIASAYLAIAFYGYGYIGLDGLQRKFGKDLSKVSFIQALRFVAQLKYPRPSTPNNEWNSNLASRINALNSLAVNRATKPLQILDQPKTLLTEHERVF